MSLPIHVAQSTPKLTKYVVQSSDVLEDSLRVDIREENSDKVLWFKVCPLLTARRLKRFTGPKERFLEDDEIIEHLVHNETRRICWTMHRPRNGWYIRIRSPSFPPGAFIPLIPPLPNTPHPSGALLFSSRTNIPTGAPLSPRVSTSSAAQSHSYPPTPPATVLVQPPTPTPASVQARLEQQQQHRRPAQVVTEFVLAPYTTEARAPAEMSFFQRALSVIRSQTAAPSYSFTLGRVPPPYLSAAPIPPLSPPVPAVESTVSLATPAPMPPPPPPLLTFHDRTPVMMVHSVTGLIEIDQVEEQSLGVESSFWIAVALTYLEFLQEKESYLAALSD
ncbi:hypothetical protein C8R46DRAFT_1271603 [Mycena filopes]|nr:hypothetical protein C8R46DRAFT_1271603 [Mycena filopes]